MKILHIIIGLNSGGAELMLSRLALSHRSNRSQHVVVSLTSVGVVGSKLLLSGIQVHALGLVGLSTLPRTIFRLFQLIRSQKPDIVQTWMYHADLLGGVIAYFCGVRRILWGIRSTDISRGGNPRTLFIRKICSLISSTIPYRIIFNSKASVLLHSQCGYDESKVVVIPNGIDWALFQVPDENKINFKSSLNLEPYLVVGAFGRFNEIKGFDLFIKAAAKVAKEKSDIRFLLAGKGMDCNNARLVSLLNATQYEDRFVMLGHRDDINLCLSILDIYCLPSRSEGFPNILGEAMSAGIPCVATDVGDAAYLMGGTGFIVKPEDAEMLADSIISMANLSSDERKVMGRFASKRVKENFSMDACVQKFDCLYKESISSAGNLY